nr:hypothetical protein 41 [bacterium]
MPRWASRLTLEILDIRIERLQEITEEDARAEGIRWIKESRRHALGNEYFYNARDAFKVLWDSLKPPPEYRWAANPWVWVVVFKTHRCNVDQLMQREAA